MSLLLRPGYFFTLMFSSALVGAGLVPVIAPGLFNLPFLAAGTILCAGLVCGVGLVLRWPTVRPMTLTYLGLLLLLSTGSIFLHRAQIAVSWMVLGCVYLILLIIFLTSRMIRRYLDAQ
ncbi:MAG: hypothetical protein IT282_08540 [Bacteroidetes bacterium]|nr:hypothetical protein [Bacteroidota bacterium]